MFKSALFLFALAVISPAVIAADANATHVGYSGTLSSLDGGLGGVVSVVDSTTLHITGYKLKDASAPALYWWGSTSDKLSSGFRISSKQVTEAAKSDMLDIKLDSGKTSTDFTVVGLWCERLSANFGQATLQATDGTSTGGSATTATGSAAAATTTKASSAGPALGGTYTGFAATIVAAAVFAVWMG